LSSQLTALTSGESWVILDLAELGGMDSGSLEALAAARERARRAGGDVLLAGPRGAVARLQLTGWDPLFASVAAAGFSARLAALTSRMAAARAGE
jgi:anti-anti-sigma regulatory factor